MTARRATHPSDAAVSLPLLGELARRLAHGVKVAVGTLGEVGTAPEHEVEGVMPAHLEVN